jgi:hypothetical protein
MPTLPDELLNLSWSRPAIDSSLAVLRRYVESEAQRQIDWYFRKMKGKSQASTALRFSAIVLFVVGGLVPICKATLAADTLRKLPFDFGEAGYLVIAIAAGCLALDRFFGYSTGWIRYVTTALAIEKSLEEFRMEWTRHTARLLGEQPNEMQLDQLLLTCATFSLAIRSQVEQETKAWVVEFQSNLAQLEEDLHARAAEIKARSGSLPTC